MELKPGSRWRSAVCETEIVVVRGPGGVDAELECGGHPVIPLDAERPHDLAIDQGFADGTHIGKRFTDANGGVEVLVTKGGRGTLSIGGQPLRQKEAKPLPSSD